MRTHLVCLTIDMDPDPPPGELIDRHARNWDGIRALHALPSELETVVEATGRTVPVTWFVRADGQLRRKYGSPLYVLERFEDLWSTAAAAGHEIGWHPHLYGAAPDGEEPALLAPAEACDELESVWQDVQTWSPPIRTMRNGEAWHTPATVATVERLGLGCDSTAIPGRRGSSPHMDWSEAPNHPYFPAVDYVQRVGGSRSLLEIPMTTWRIKAPYDAESIVRYMNPSVHERFFLAGLSDWQDRLATVAGALFVWVLVCHPFEVLEDGRSHALYSHCREVLLRNVISFIRTLESGGDSVDCVTLSEAAARWRQHAGGS